VECVVSLKRLLLLRLTLLMMLMTCPVDLRLWTSINDTSDVVTTRLTVTTPNIQHLVSGGHQLRFICYKIEIFTEMLDLTVLSVWHVTSIWLGTCPCPVTYVDDVVHCLFDFLLCVSLICFVRFYSLIFCYHLMVK